MGYPHVGYNVGGVAGRQSGYMASCENTGTVQGRKDVGGIVGQMAPDVTLSYAPGSLEELQEALNALGGSVDKTLADAQSVSDTVTARIDRISGYADTARDSANALTGQLTGFLNGNVDAVNNLVLLVERYLAKLSPILDDLSAASAETSETLNALERAADTLAGLEELNEEFLTCLEDFCRETSAACDDLSAAADALDAALGGISSELSGLNGDLSQASSLLIADLRTVNNQFMTVMNLFLNLLSNTVNVDYTGVWEDVSEESLQSAVRGKVLECVNRGAVEADRNAGGVYGPGPGTGKGQQHRQRQLSLLPTGRGSLHGVGGEEADVAALGHRRRRGASGRRRSRSLGAGEEKAAQGGSRNINKRPLEPISPVPGGAVCR